MPIKIPKMLHETNQTRRQISNMLGYECRKKSIDKTRVSGCVFWHRLWADDFAICGRRSASTALICTGRKIFLKE